MSYDREAEILEDQIAATRARMEARLDGLTDNLTPSGLLQRSLGTSSARMDSSETLAGLVDKARTNPLSALVTGLGIASMLYNSYTENKRPEHVETEDDHIHGFTEGMDAEQRLRHNAEVLKTKARGTATNISASASELAQAARRTADDAASSAKSTGAEFIDRATDRMENISDKISSTSRNAADNLRRTPVRAKAGAEAATDWVKENPVPASLMALALGATIASLATARRASTPLSRRDASQRLYEQAEREENTPPKRKPVKRASAPTTKTSARRKSAVAASKAPKPAATKPVAQQKTTPEKKSAAKSVTQRADALRNSPAMKRATAVQGIDPVEKDKST